MTVLTTFKTLIGKFKSAGAYTKRGIIYITIASLFILYELIFQRPLRTNIILIWLGVVVFSFFIMRTFKDPNR